MQTTLKEALERFGNGRIKVEGEGNNISISSPFSLEELLELPRFFANEPGDMATKHGRIDTVNGVLEKTGRNVRAVFGRVGEAEVEGDLQDIYELSQLIEALKKS